MIAGLDLTFWTIAESKDDSNAIFNALQEILTEILPGNWKLGSGVWNSTRSNVTIMDTYGSYFSRQFSARFAYRIESEPSVMFQILEDLYALDPKSIAGVESARITLTIHSFARSWHGDEFIHLGPESEFYIDRDGFARAKEISGNE